MSTSIYTSSYKKSHRLLTLYLKQHRKTKLKYLGVTASDIDTYDGSGNKWQEHLEKHGTDVRTLVLLQTWNQNEFRRICKKKSIELDVVKRTDYANMIHENGIITRMSIDEEQLNELPPLERIWKRSEYKKGAEQYDKCKRLFPELMPDTWNIFSLGFSYFMQDVGHHPTNLSLCQTGRQNLKGKYNCFLTIGPVNGVLQWCFRDKGEARGDYSEYHAINEPLTICKIADPLAKFGVTKELQEQATLFSKKDNDFRYFSKRRLLWPGCPERWLIFPEKVAYLLFLQDVGPRPKPEDLAWNEWAAIRFLNNKYQWVRFIKGSGSRGPEGEKFYAI